MELYGLLKPPSPLYKISTNIQFVLFLCRFVELLHLHQLLLSMKYRHYGVGSGSFPRAAVLQLMKKVPCIFATMHHNTAEMCITDCRLARRYTYTHAPSASGARCTIVERPGASPGSFGKNSAHILNTPVMPLIFAHLN